VLRDVRDRRVLIIGSSGQIGSELVRAISPEFPVIALDRRHLDVTDSAAIHSAFERYRPFIVINAAAYTAVDRAETEQELARQVNAVAPGRLADAARRFDCAIVHYSTDYVFDGRKRGKYVETDAANPLNVYGRTKYEGELAVAASGARNIVLRTSWVYSEHSSNFLKTILRLAAERPRIQVVNDQWGTPNAAGSLALSTLEILRKEVERDQDVPFRNTTGTYHLSAGGGTTWFAFAQRILETYNRRAGCLNQVPQLRVEELEPITTDQYGAPAIRPMNSVLDSSKISNTYGLPLPWWTTDVEGVISRMLETRTMAGADKL